MKPARSVIVVVLLLSVVVTAAVGIYLFRRIMRTHPRKEAGIVVDGAT